MIFRPYFAKPLPYCMILYDFSTIFRQIVANYKILYDFSTILIIRGGGFMNFIIAALILVLGIRVWHVESKLMDIRAKMNGTNERFDAIIDILNKDKAEADEKVDEK